MVESMIRDRDSSALILRAACAEFAEHGYAGARVARIATRAKVNKQLIFYYFGTKAGLYSAATGPGQGGEHLAPSDAATPIEQFRDLINRLANHLEQHPELATALTDREAGIRPAAPGRQFLEQAGRMIGATISRGQGMGYFRDDLDPRLATRQALVLLTGFHALAPALSEQGDASRWGPAATDLLLRAFAW
jgi:TetR/AcrR family transcriptional regulator